MPGSAGNSLKRGKKHGDRTKAKGGGNKTSGLKQLVHEQKKGRRGRLGA
jgi:hypothetical protein